MKIKQVSCTQFAGIRDRQVSFADGINVVYGKNESGKSTLVNLIARTLFQNAKLDGRTDKEFRDLYFPAAGKGSAIAGDFADGRVSFETKNGTYTLSKEWGADARCTLSAAEGVLRDPNTIRTMLKDALQYGEGVYCDMLFSSQRNADAALQTILDAAKKTDAKQEITEAVSQAFAESDGISVDAIELAIEDKIEELAGKHWDFDRQQPVRKAGRWVNGLGEVLKAYYALEDATQVLEELSRLEMEAERTAKDYGEKDAAAGQAQRDYENFQGFAAQLAVQSERKKALERIDRELQKITDVLSKWPQMNEKLDKAKKLQQEKNDRNVLDIYNFVKETGAELTDADISAAEQACPDRTEISEIERYRREIVGLENRLCGMNLTAKIQMAGGNEVKIISLRTGEPVDLSDGIASITETVKIVIDGVMEMQLSPADVDVAAVEAQIAERKAIMDGVFRKYGVKSPEELSGYAGTIEEAKSKIERVNARIASVLGNVSIEQLEERYQRIGPVNRPKEQIEQDIYAVCGMTDPATFIAKAEAVVDGYAAEYGSINDLKAKAFDLDAEGKKIKGSLSEGQDIPSRYLEIADPEAYLQTLQRELKYARELREAALTEKTAAASRLESCRENSKDDPAAEAERAKNMLEEQKLLLSHWLQIRQVFRQQKETLHNDPMQDIADRFSYYLGAISDGSVTSEFPQGDKLNMNIYSANRLVDYGKLSEGTKETVWLAFRLAVLDHLFPEGGGVIVFDDPFTDMDAGRMEKACGLLLECAERHQVIFLTCSKSYLERLGGNQILL